MIEIFSEMDPRTSLYNDMTAAIVDGWKSHDSLQEWLGDTGHVWSNIKENKAKSSYSCNE